MAKIRYIINNNMFESMVAAIKSENIMYSVFHKKFKELWGRLSINYYGDAWIDSMALSVVDGVDVFGNYRIYLFKDSSVSYKYTEEFCKIVGADYDAMLSDLGNVENFWVDLSGLSKGKDFSNETVVQTSMNNIKTILNQHSIDRLEISFVVDTEIDSNADENLALSQIRNLNLPIDSNTGDYITNITGLVPVLKYYGLPGSTVSYAPEDTLQENPIYTLVEGSEISVPEISISSLLTTFGKHSSYLDRCFNSVDLNVEILADRDGGIDFITGMPLTYHRYKYTINFKFESSVDLSDGSVTNLIDWNYLSSAAFSSLFVAEYSAHSTYYAQNTDDNMYYSTTNQSTLVLSPPNSFLVFGALLSSLDSYNSANDLFYNKVTGGGNLFAVNVYKTYLKYDKVQGMRNKDFADLLLYSIKFGYNKQSSGWFGGSMIGKFFEALFTFVVVAAGVIFSIIFWNPYPLLIAMAVLFVGSKYTGMSASGVKLAGVGMKVLAVAGVAMSVTNIFNAAYEAASDAATEEIASTLSEQSMRESSSSTVATEVGVLDVVSQLGVTEVAQLSKAFYDVYSLLLPSEMPNSEYSELEDEDESVSDAVESVSEFYDDELELPYAFIDHVYDSMDVHTNIDI